MLKFYAILRGHKTGIFSSWKECQESIKGFPKAKFKSFKNMAVATKWLESKGERSYLIPKGADKFALSVDGACNMNDGIGEYRGVILPSGKEIFRFGPYENATNNVMEYLAIVRGLRWLAKKEIEAYVFSDSQTAINWLLIDGLCSTSNPPPQGSLLQMEIASAERWIGSNRAKLNLLRKWNTSELGECPSDFNRK